MSTFQYFKWSILFTVLGLVAGYALAGSAGALAVGVLGILEASLSFDNAVINTKHLAKLDAVWRRRYLIWGMALSVGVMRLLLPLLLVAVLAQMTPWAAVHLAFSHPLEYAKVLTSAHHQVSAFGGLFLLMVFLKYFVDQHKQNHWLHVLEAPLTRLGKLEGVEVAVALLVLALNALLITDVAIRAEFLLAGVFGLITYLAVSSLSALCHAEGDTLGPVAKSGLTTFLYLEVQDASFSFDGVIGAFALSTNIVLITIGLAIGALFVRSFTLMMVDKGTLQAYRYLEHGAFWAVGALAGLMLLGVQHHVPELATGVVGASLIGLSLYSSLRANKIPDSAKN